MHHARATHNISFANHLPPLPTARKHLQFFAYKLARHCADTEEHCVEIPANVTEPCRTIPVDVPVFLIQRAYLEPETKVGPVPEELIQAQVIVFNKKS